MEEYFMKDSKSAKATLDNGLDDYFKSKDAEKEEGEVEKAGEEAAARESGGRKRGRLHPGAELPVGSFRRGSPPRLNL